MAAKDCARCARPDTLMARPEVGQWRCWPVAGREGAGAGRPWCWSPCAGQCQGRGGGAREEGSTKKESEVEERGEEGHPSPTHTGGPAGQRGMGTAHAAREGARACDPRPAGAPTPHPTHALPTSSQVKRERGERFLTGVLAFFHLPASAGGNL